MKISFRNYLFCLGFGYFFASTAAAQIPQTCQKEKLGLLEQTMRLHDLTDEESRNQKDCLVAVSKGDLSKIKPPVEPDWYHTLVLCPQGIATGLAAKGAQAIGEAANTTESGFQMAKNAGVASLQGAVYLVTTPPWVVAQDAAQGISSAAHFVASLDLKKQVFQTTQILPAIGTAIWEIFNMSLATGKNEFSCMSKEAQTKKICNFIFVEAPAFLFGGALIKSINWITGLERLLKTASLVGSSATKYIKMLFELLHVKDPKEAANKLKLLIAELQENPDVLRLLNQLLDESNDPEMKALKNKLAIFTGSPEKLLAKQAAAAEKVREKFSAGIKLEELNPSTIKQPHFAGAIQTQLSLAEKKCLENPESCKLPSILYSQDIKESSLPYKLGISPVSQSTTSTVKTLSQDVDITVTDTIIASKSQNGSQGIVYLGYLKDGTPVGIKKFFMMGRKQVPAPAKEAANAAELNSLGINGNSFFGVMNGPLENKGNVDTGLVFKIIPGDSKGTASTSQTMKDVEEIIRRLKENPNFNKPQDIQFLRTQNGRVLVIDEINQAKEVPGTDSAMETATQTFTLFRYKNLAALEPKAGIEYLRNLKQTDPQGHRHLIGELARMGSQDPAIAPKLKKWIGP